MKKLFIILMLLFIPFSALAEENEEVISNEDIYNVSLDTNNLVNQLIELQSVEEETTCNRGSFGCSLTDYQYSWLKVHQNEWLNNDYVVAYNENDNYVYVCYVNPSATNGYSYTQIKASSEATNINPGKWVSDLFKGTQSGYTYLYANNDYLVINSSDTLNIPERHIITFSNYLDLFFDFILGIIHSEIFLYVSLIIITSALVKFIVDLVLYSF